MMFAQMSEGVEMFSMLAVQVAAVVFFPKWISAIAISCVKLPPFAYVLGNDDSRDYCLRGLMLVISLIGNI